MNEPDQTYHGYLFNDVGTNQTQLWEKGYKEVVLEAFNNMHTPHPFSSLILANSCPQQPSKR